MKFFNIRTYGILINERQEILISDELYHGQQFSKFPGGGLEFGESLPDAIRREFIEECDLNIKEIELLYITDTVVQSAFNDSQVLGVYYQVFTDETIMSSQSSQTEMNNSLMRASLPLKKQPSTTSSLKQTKKNEHLLTNYSGEKLRVSIKTKAFDFNEGSVQSFRWIPLKDFSAHDLTFQMDQDAWKAVQGKIFLK